MIPDCLVTYLLPGRVALADTSQELRGLFYEWSYNHNRQNQKSAKVTPAVRMLRLGFN